MQLLRGRQRPGKLSCINIVSMVKGVNPPGPVKRRDPPWPQGPRAPAFLRLGRSEPSGIQAASVWRSIVSSRTLDLQLGQIQADQADSDPAERLARP